MKKNTFLGLIGILGIWLTAGLALPFVNVLKMFTPEQLMVFRGFFTAAMAFIVLRGNLKKVDRYALLIALTLPFATLGLFKGIRSWGANPTVIIFTVTPLVNLIVSMFLGRRITGASIIGLILMLGGVILARHGGHFQWQGFIWSVFGTIMNGLLYEFFARSKTPSLQKCMWACTGMGCLGLVLSIHTSWEPVMNPKVISLLITFAFIGGFLYWIANLLAFENLPTTEASVLAQGETPAVIIGSFLLLGEVLTMNQWIGVALSLFGAWYLSHWLAQKKEILPTPP